MGVMDGIKIPTHSTDAYRTGYDRIFSGKEAKSEDDIIKEAFYDWACTDAIYSRNRAVVFGVEDLFLWKAAVEWQKKRK